jgi:hypothetical protein
MELVLEFNDDILESSINIDDEFAIGCGVI